MVLNNYSFFQAQDNKCYKPHGSFDSEILLDDFLSNNFHDFDFYIQDNYDNKVRQCENKAFEYDKSLFIVTDLSKNQGKDFFTYKCLIPKVENSCNNIENLITPFTTLINDLFGEQNNRHSELITTEISDDIANIANLNDTSDCIFIKNNNNDKYYFSKNRNFIIYQKKFLVNNNSMKDYINRLTEPSTYDTSFTSWKNNIQDTLYDISDSYTNYISNSTTDLGQGYLEALDIAITRLQNEYKNIFDYLANISTDVSNLKFIISNNKLELEIIQNKINDEKEKLNSLIGFDGANNGKLSDTKFLKNLKISENIILFIVIIFVIYAYTKKKI
jgi:hypothetical protein